MQLAKLKKIRVFISLVFLLFTTLLFIDLHSFIPLEYYNKVLYLQFIPSILKFIFNPVSLSLGFAFILLLTLILGRVYCSSICPLGTLQDMVIRIRRRFKNQKFDYSKPHSALHYGILVITIITLLSGSLFLVDLLDPLGIFGRFAVDFIRLPLALGNNLLSLIFVQFGWYILPPVKVVFQSLGAFISVIVSMIVVIWMSVKHGRLFCNTICPIGSLLALFARFSLFKIEINQSKCEQCGLCEQACKSGCIDNALLKVDFDRCISCFNCFEVCNLDGFQYKCAYNDFRNVIPANAGIPNQSDSLDNNTHNKLEFKRNPLTPFEKGGIFIPPFSKGVRGFLLNFREQFLNFKSIPTDNRKRTFLFEIGCAALTFTGIATLKNNNSKWNNRTPVAPPGSVGIEHFTERCTACQTCVSICPNQVLQPTFLDYGWRGILQPKLDFNAGYCHYECFDCSLVCPTGAIQPMNKEKKRLIQTGVVEFEIKKCIVETNKTECGACAEHCPTKACSMDNYKGKLKIPVINKEICVGCGACEYICPVKPDKAIYVVSNFVHKVSKLPANKKIEKKPVMEDFPF
ncbi:MAG: yccM 1 [Ignavibacteria bacterium]|nr:yccM 1 [Ignavibacteria bacterium]